MRFLVVIALFAPAAAFAGVPDVITYAGALEQSGAPANGTFTAVFTLFDDATAGNAKFTQTEASLAVIGGAIVVDLGAQAGDPLDDSVLATGVLFLEVSINGETLAPRVPLNSVPYARFAKHAEDVNGLDANAIAALNSADPNGGLVDNGGAFSIADNGVTSAKIADGTITGADVADGSIPVAKLDLSGHAVGLFVVPTGVNFCAGFTPSEATVVPECQSVPRNEVACQSLLPLPATCACLPNGSTQSFALCTFTFVGDLLK